MMKYVLEMRVARVLKDVHKIRDTRRVEYLINLRDMMLLKDII